MLENYHEPEELLSDESFLNWYFKTGTRKDPGQEKEWEIWMAGEPARRELVEQAIKLLDTTRIPEKGLPAGQIQAAEWALMNRIGENLMIPQVQPGRTASATIGNRRVWVAAAVFLVLAISGWLLRRTLFTGRSEFRTEYGQIMQRRLPDGTEVTLDANSKVSWSIAKQDGADREVWLSGEAFFHVHKTPLKSRFIVHTDHFDIQVLGTQFNVINRPAQDNVLLSEGSVMLQTSEGGKLKMVPGDFVQFNGGQLEKQVAREDSLTAWKDHKLKLNNTPLRTLAAIITEQYGVEVRLEEGAKGDQPISGILSNNNLDVLLRALELSEKFDVTRKDGIILIKGR